jgi:hypothetical protein
MFELSGGVLSSFIDTPTHALPSILPCPLSFRRVQSLPLNAALSQAAAAMRDGHWRLAAVNLTSGIHS